ncbi:MAG: hypothetical protein A2138_16850 [Deltaproteobacteria bacterium RBG_16_71_12]|nr:MAG: hypothetical protein A2138_16850 [Deltaproteobacteria bacterium RBG_16_71_12]
MTARVEGQDYRCGADPGLAGPASAGYSDDYWQWFTDGTVGLRANRLGIKVDYLLVYGLP